MRVHSDAPHLPVHPSVCPQDCLLAYQQRLAQFWLRLFTPNHHTARGIMEPIVLAACHSLTAKKNEKRDSRWQQDIAYQRHVERP